MRGENGSDSKSSAKNERSNPGRLGRILRGLRVPETLLMLGFPLIGALHALTEPSLHALQQTLVFALATYLLFSSIYCFNSFCGHTADRLNVRLARTRFGSARAYLLLSLASWASVCPIGQGR